MTNLCSFPCLIVVLFGLYNLVCGQTVVIPPRSVNASLNGVAEFNCTGTGSLLGWRRDGNELTNGVDGISILHVTIGETLMSTLRLPVSSASAANVTCVAIKSIFPLVLTNESEPALLLVQGLLKSVSNLATMRVNFTTVLISWSPPFTLEGVPILGYNITITNTSGENDTVSIAGDTTKLYYSIQSSFTVTVVPINSVGPGDKASILHTTTSTSQAVVPSASIATSAMSITPFSSSLPLRGDNQLPAIVGGILGAVAVLIGVALVLLFVCVLYRRRHSSKNTSGSVDENDIALLERNESLQAVLTSLESANLIIPQDNIKFLNKIGNGNFGKVKKAKLKDSGKLVAVKTCDPEHSVAVQCQFLYEADILRHYKHPNIVDLYGVVAKDPLRIVMEYVGWTFEYFLRANGHKCHVDKLTDMCKQVSDGMAYLERNECVHRGLTARNCLVNSDHTVVKISNFGMSFGTVNIDPNDPKLRKVPIKWTAPEALIDDHQYSSASDVWSFGILLWETFSRGKEPYLGIPNEAVRKKVKDGYRMDPPEDCPPTVFDLMNECWEYDPKDRPTFAKILSELKDIQTD